MGAVDVVLEMNEFWKHSPAREVEQTDEQSEHHLRWIWLWTSAWTWGSRAVVARVRLGGRCALNSTLLGRKQAI